MRMILTCFLVLAVAGPAFAADPHEHHAVPTLQGQTTTAVITQGNTVTLTFGPIDLPSAHDGELAASMPKHIFALPKDMYLVGFKSAVFTKGGKPLPQNYLHHILMLNNDKESVSCPGEPLFFAGLEMTEARFPKGYGVKLGKGKNSCASSRFTMTRLDKVFSSLKRLKPQRLHDSARDGPLGSCQIKVPQIIRSAFRVSSELPKHSHTDSLLFCTC